MALVGMSMYFQCIFNQCIFIIIIILFGFFNHFWGDLVKAKPLREPEELPI